jgi:DNA-binding response OmpR family regulator
MMAMLLEAEAIPCKMAGESDEALRLLAEEEPALMVLDLMLGGRDESGLIAESRALGYQGPVLLCTGISGDPPVATEGVIKKPFEPDDLIAKIRELAAV